MTREGSTEADGGVETTHGSALDREGSTGAGTAARIATVARLEYRLSLRNRWAFALTALFGLLAGLLAGFGGSGPGPVRVDAVIVSLASLATYLVPLAALVYGFDAVVGAEESGWLDIVFAFPVPRSWVVAGTALGRAATLAGATAVGFGVGGVVLFVRAGTVTWSLYATVLLGTVALGLAFLAMSVLVSSVAVEKTHALGVALLVWVWFVFGHDLVALGLVAWIELPPGVLSAFVLANPVDVFRVLVLSGIDSTGGGMAAVVANTDLSTPVLALAALAWIVAPVAVAARAVRRRSL
ncbi:ABC transporter permease [Halomarina pelagica]|uniref:ABC transporter permease n=1 Tax=Halomarina pelagica TaxID=2961599 RepID=UPI0020C5AAC8|nr:ABC transporter permease subunit [Halomarina sp. BND7]